MSEEKSMNDYENELERSFQVLREGDILDVTVIGVSDTEVTVDLNYYTEGIIPIEECSDDPSFLLKGYDHRGCDPGYGTGPGKCQW